MDMRRFASTPNNSAEKSQTHSNFEATAEKSQDTVINSDYPQVINSMEDEDLNNNHVLNLTSRTESSMIFPQVFQYASSRIEPPSRKRVHNKRNEPILNEEIINSGNFPFQLPPFEGNGECVTCGKHTTATEKCGVSDYNLINEDCSLIIT